MPSRTFLKTETLEQHLFKMARSDANNFDAINVRVRTGPWCVLSVFEIRSAIRRHAMTEIVQQLV